MTGMINMLGLLLQAQPLPASARDEYLFYNDKFNTVLIVLAVILVGIFVLQGFLGMKLKKVEKTLDELEQKVQQKESGGS